MNVISMIANILAPAKDAATYATYLGRFERNVFRKEQGKVDGSRLKKVDYDLSCGFGGFRYCVLYSAN